MQESPREGTTRVQVEHIGCWDWGNCPPGPPARQWIADRETNPEPVQRLRAHRVETRSRPFARHAPVGTAGDRGTERVAHEVEAVDAAIDEGFAPEIAHVRQQRLDVGHARMNVAVDAAQKGGQVRHGLFESRSLQGTLPVRRDPVQGHLGGFLPQ